MKIELLRAQFKRYIAGSFWDGDNYQYCGNCDYYQDPCDTSNLLGEACYCWKFGIPLTDEYIELEGIFKDFV